jgi:hypothetical protein
MNVKDVISPIAFSLWQFFGYAVFAIAWAVILFAFLRALLEAVQQERTILRMRRARMRQVLVFPGTAGSAPSLVLVKLMNSRAREATPHGSL